MSIESALSSATVAGITASSYFGLVYAETVGLIDPISIVEKFGITGLVFVGALSAMRWLLKDRERLEKKIEDLQSEQRKMNDSRLEEQRNYFEQIIKTLEK